MSRSIVVASRSSRLAVIQAESVAAGLREAHAGLSVRLSKIKTRGDRDKRPFLEIDASRGLFVKELEEALLDGRADVAVHSLKDMPVDTPPGLRLAAVPFRLDPRDALVSKGDTLDRLPPGARTGTGSRRRAVQVMSYRSDLQVVDLRGNVDTRLGKVESGELDAVILAAAGLIRLGLQDRITEYLPTDRFLPAVGQGALGIETREDGTEASSIVAPLNHQPSWCVAVAECAFLRGVGGGCSAPIGALGVLTDDRLLLEGMVADPDSGAIMRASEEGSHQAPEEVGIRLAERLLEMGAREAVGETRD